MAGERIQAAIKAEQDVTPRPTLSVQEQLCFAVYSTSHAFSRRYKPLLQGLGLTYPQYLCMLVLWEADDLTVGAIGQQLHLDSGTLTPLLKRLEAAGLVSRTRDQRDERQVRIRLTAAGQVMAGKAADFSRQIICATGHALPDLIQLRDKLMAIRDHMNDTPE